MPSGDAIFHIANRRALEVITRTFMWPDGDVDEPDFDEPTFDTDDCEPDEWNYPETAVSIAAERLTDLGCTQPSSSPGPWNQFTWFSYVDGSYISNHYTGERTEVSAHPKNFTDREVDAIAAIVTGIASPYIPDEPEGD